MATKLEYALFAANVYGSRDRNYVGPQAQIRHSNNTLPMPDGWEAVGDPVVKIDGFMAQAYRRGNEIVISYAGTTNEDVLDWVTGNVPAATAATLAPQVLDAAKYYLSVRAANPAAQISFTGHSLGGGLASLMAVYFDRPATVFDEAPFIKSADSLVIVNALKQKLTSAGGLPFALQTYVAVDQTGAFVPSPTRMARDDQVVQIYVKGEALSILSTTLTNFLAIALGRANLRLGIAAFGIDKINDGLQIVHDPRAQTLLGWGASLNGVNITDGDPVSLHSISLLTGFVQTPEFLTLAQDYPELLPRMMAGMFKDQPKQRDANLLDLLVQREYRGEGAMAALIADVRKIDRSNGLTSLRDVPGAGNVNGDADYVAAIAVDAVLAGIYSQGKERAPGEGFVGTFDQVLEQVLGGIRFDISGFSADARALNTRLDHLVTLLLGPEANAANYTNDARWTLQSGADALYVTQPEDGKTDVMVGFDLGDSLVGGDGDDQLIGLGGNDTLKGGMGIDALVGGDGNDLLQGGVGTDYLYGSAGADTLQGGANGDWLLGGAGHDTYVLDGPFGSDWITDSDGDGRILVDSIQLTGADAKKIEGRDSWIDDGWLYDKVPNADGGFDLMLRRDSSLNTIRIRNWSNGQLGISLGDQVAALSTNVTLDGDFVKKTELDVDGMPAYVEGPNGYESAGVQADAADVINGGTGAELIRGWGGNDGLSGGLGDDSIEGGEGDDLIYGGGGRDRLIGGNGNDVIAGSYGQWIFTPADDDFTFDALRVGYEQAIGGFSWRVSRRPASEAAWSAAIEFANGVGQRGPGFDFYDGGNYIDAGDGDDMVWAGWGPDVVYAGADNDSVRGMDSADVIYGQAGDDLLLGDGVGSPDNTSIYSYSPPENHGDDVLDGGAGNDVLQGQLGNDALYGGADNDTLWGDSADNYVPGPSGTLHGQDMLSGGSGNDVLYGDGGGDDLYGDDGNDTLMGDLDGMAPPGSADYVATQFHGGDYLDGGSGADVLLGHGGNDDLFGGTGNDTISGDAGQDQLAGSAHGDDYLDGEEGDDQLFGNGGNDALFGGVDNDTLVGDADSGAFGVDGLFHGRDYLDGEGGNDLLLGSGGGDELFGGDDMDTLRGDARVQDVAGDFHGNDYLDGEAGDDTLIGDGGNDSLYGGTGNDQLQGDVATAEESALEGQFHGSDALDGEDGNDLLFGGGGADDLLGGEGNDTLRGDVSVQVVAAQFHSGDRLDGGAGDDVLFGDGGADNLDGGDGNDWLAGEDEVNGSVVSMLTGDDRLDGGSGNDTLLGGNGNDQLDGGQGSDILLGGAGNDVLMGDGQDYLVGGAGDDSYLVTLQAVVPGQITTAVIHDAVGINRLAIDGVTMDQLLVVNVGGQILISAGEAGAVTLTADTSLEGMILAPGMGAGTGNAEELTVRELIQRDSSSGLMQGARLMPDGGLAATGSANTSQDLKGTANADLLEGGSAGDDLDGKAGNDLLQGNAGRDVLRGGPGRDTLEGGAGDDALFGGADGQSDAATDTFVFNRGDGNDTLQIGEGGQGVLRFGAGITRESLVVGNLGGASDASRIIHIEYGAGDAVTLDAGSDARLSSVVFADGSSMTRAELIGATPAYTAGNDSLTGTSSADLLDGGAGHDTLQGLAGDDTLSGGDGNDVLAGGAGRNTYRFAANSGTDAITPTAGETATLRFSEAAPGTLRASVDGSDLWLIQANGARVRVTGYANTPALADWTVVAADGTSQTLGALCAASAAAEALAARKDNFLAAQRVALGAGPVEQNLDPAAPTATYRHFRTDTTLTVDVVRYERVPQYEQTTTTRVNLTPDLLNLLQNPPNPNVGGSSGSGGDTFGMFTQTTTSNRLVGWNHVKSTSTVTLPSSTSAQLNVTGTAGNDSLVADNSTAPVGHALFRGSVSTGDGHDSIDLNGISSSWYRTDHPGNGAWIELGEGNDRATGTDADDVFIGGVGADTLRGDAGADTYLAAADGSVDRIHDDLDWLGVDWGAGVDRSGWSFDESLEVAYAGGAGLDRIEFDTSVQRSLLTQRFQGNTLLLFQDGTKFLEIDYRPESLAAHLSGAASGAMAGVERFRFSDGTEISLHELVATTPQAPIVGSDDADELYGTDGADTLVGGGGNDYLEGAAGSDVYVFSGRFGHDDVSDGAGPSSPGDINEIRFTDRVPSQVYATRDDWSVVLVDKSTGDRVAIPGTWSLPTDPEAGLLGADWRVRFADGTVWTPAQVAAAMEPRRIGAGDDLWYGTEGDDIGDALAGDDRMIGRDGNDVLRGGAGADDLLDTLGNNLLDGGEGDDGVSAQGGTSVLIGGAGNDVVAAFAGAASSAQLVLFNAADGQDRVALDVSAGRRNVLSVGGGLNERSLTLRLANGEVVLDFGGASRLTMSGIDSSPSDGALILQVVEAGSIRSFDLGAVVRDFTAAAQSDPPVLDLPALAALQAQALGSSAEQAYGGLLAYRYAIDGNLAAVSDATLQEHLRAPGFAAQLQSIFGLGIVGTDGNDSLVGTARDDWMRGLAGNDTLDGSAGADTLEGGAGSDSLRGGSGDDTYIVDATTDVITERANEGTDAVRSSVTWTLGGNLEHLTLTGSAAINGSGNAGANWLVGNTANNTLNGGSGADTLQAGAGDDIYVIDNAGDVIVELDNEGTDRVNASVTATLAANVENLTLTGTASVNGTGNALNNALTGNSAANNLDGGAGNDTLNGGAGADTLNGGAGNDTFVVDAASDVVIEAADEGIDTVQSAVDFTLGASFENLTLTGSVATIGIGNALNNLITGNGLGNRLDAGAGDDTLSGGAGVDTLIGGSGNDTYVVNMASDVVTENADDGIDSVQSSASLTLAANVERLQLTGTANLNGTGNAVANLIVGNGGNNTLDGGSGGDTLQGGAGNDTYVIDNAADMVLELVGEGVDLVRASLSTTLWAHVENLTLTGTLGTSATGNELDNALTGNAANNALAGGAGNDTLNGGAGNDTMSGGLGNDFYVVNTAADLITEAADEGIDSVQSSVTLTLSGNVENLTLTGTGNLNGSGNALDNLLAGNGGNNTLSGGAGNDIYQGGAGNDTLVDTSVTSADVYRWGLAQGSDSITDAGGADRIELGAGIDATQVTLTRSGNDLRVGVTGQTDALTVRNWYLAVGNRIETISLADGTLLDAGTAAPLSVATTTTLAREATQMRHFGGIVRREPMTAVADQAPLERRAQWLVQAMSQFGAATMVDAVPALHRHHGDRLTNLATPL